MLKAVLFDLDQTLLNRDATFVSFMRIQHRRYASLMPGVTEDDYVAALRRFDLNGYTEKDEMFAKACELLGIPGEAGRLVEDFKSIYGSEPVVFADSLATLEKLRGRYRLGMVTNGRTYAQNQKITHSGLRSYFEDIRVSETEGVEKPDARIFLRCVEALGVEPAEAVYIGDHAENDVVAAISAGL
ncbi:MAG: HAD family hydrolase, partial [Verrucomicrobiales bacterium]